MTTGYEYWWYVFEDGVWGQVTPSQHNDLLIAAAITGGDCKYAVKEVEYEVYYD